VRQLIVDEDLRDHFDGDVDALLLIVSRDHDGEEW
jgi:hypothetical protein